MFPPALTLGVCMCTGSRIHWDLILGRVDGGNDVTASDAYTSNTIFCGIKALWFSIVSHYLCFRRHSSPDESVWYEDTGHLGTFLGVNFFLWEILDLVYCLYHKIATRDMIFHHVFHILVAPFVMMFATPTWYYVGARLILQETSGVPLAVATLFRHRSATIARPAFVAFSIAFFVYRILSTGHVLLSMHRQEVMLCTLILPAYMLQWMWFYKIVKRLARSHKEE